MRKLNYTIVVSGKVQGVWFRRYTKEKADELGIMGFVKNSFDKKVLITAEGSEEILKEFIDWLYKGSPLSRVADVSYENSIDVQDYTEFSIRRG